MTITPAAQISLFISAEASRDLRWLPSHMHEGLARYLLQGQTPGSFLIAVLSNDFMQAAMRADDINQECLYQWAKWLYCHAPRECYGSEKAVAEWKGLLPEGTVL